MCKGVFLGFKMGALEKKERVETINEIQKAQRVERTSGLSHQTHLPPHGGTTYFTIAFLQNSLSSDFERGFMFKSKDMSYAFDLPPTSMLSCEAPDHLSSTTEHATVTV